MLSFQRFVYRRAWGTYYALWSVAFVGFIFVGQLPLSTLVPRELSWAPYAVLYGVAGWGAGIATAWIFNNASRTISLRKVAGGQRPQQGQPSFVLVWIWSIGIFVLSFISFVYFQREALTILYAMLLSVEVFLYYILRFTFQEIPFEGKLALTSYGFAVVFSLFASLLTDEFLPFGVVWGATIALWLFCALYALAHAPEELVELRY